MVVPFDEHDFRSGGEVKDRLVPVRDLDWEGFSSAYFPGSRRHDLDAITAYRAYKRSRVVAEQSTPGGGSREAERSSTRAASIEASEDEGGTAR